MELALQSKLDDIFKNEVNFSKGVYDYGYYAEQFHYFFLALQYLYFNNLHIGKYNKLCASFNIYLNPTAKFYIRIIQKLRRIEEVDYEAELDIESFLISNLHFFEKIVEKRGLADKTEISLNNRFDVDLYNGLDEAYFKPIVNVYNKCNKIEKHIENVVLTNSLVSLDYKKGYSDVDAIVFLKRDAFESIGALKEVKKTISQLLKQVYLFDPFQHHCFYVLNQVDLSFYPQAFYPTILFEHSVNLIDKDSKLSYRFRADNIEKKLALYKILKVLINYTEHKDAAFQNLTTLKHFISNITLLPVFYIQLVNGYTYKRDAFKQIHEHFDDLSMFNMAEKIRSEFPYTRMVKYFPSFLHPSINSLMHGKLYRHDISNTSKEIKPLTRSFLENFIDKLYHAGI